MKDKVLKLCRRLKCCTISDLIQFTDIEKDVIETIIAYLEDEGLIQNKNGLISISSVKKNKRNINHLHGQIDFTFINTPEIAKRDFDDDNFYTIYKLKKDVKNVHMKYVEGNLKNTQNGEHLKQTTIITGKNKTEKIAIPPFDTYRTNLQKCLIQNSNLLIIGYGFADYYVNNILNQFNKIHKENTRVNIIDFEDETAWKDLKFDPFKSNSNRWATIYNLFKDSSFESIFRKDYISPQLFNNDINKLWLRGFKDVAENHLSEIIETYSR